MADDNSPSGKAKLAIELLVGLVVIVGAIYGACVVAGGWLKDVIRAESRELVDARMEKVDRKLDELIQSVQGLDRRVARLEGRLNMTSKNLREAERKVAAALGAGERAVSGYIKNVNASERRITLETLEGEMLQMILSPQVKSLVIVDSKERPIPIDVALGVKAETAAILVWHAEARSTSPVVNTINLIGPELSP